MEEQAKVLKRVTGPGVTSHRNTLIRQLDGMVRTIRRDLDPKRRMTRSVLCCIPTQSVGTITASHREIDGAQAGLFPAKAGPTKSSACSQ